MQRFTFLMQFHISFPQLAPSDLIWLTLGQNSYCTLMIHSCPLFSIDIHCHPVDVQCRASPSKDNGQQSMDVNCGLQIAKNASIKKSTLSIYIDLLQLDTITIVTSHLLFVEFLFKIQSCFFLKLP